MASKAMKITRVKLASLVEDPANARTHGEENIAAIRSSLRVFGQVEALVVQKSTRKIIGGNGRYRAMKAEGWTEADIYEIDCDNVTAASLAVTLNRTAELAGWNKDALEKILRELGPQDDGLDAMMADLAKAQSIDLSELASGGIGGEAKEDAGAEPDRAAELQAKWGTETGQVWLIPSNTVSGRDHRLLVGDSTNPEDVTRVMAGAKATLVFTDPPYGVAIGAKNRLLNSVQKSGRNLTDIEDDSITPDALKARLVPAFVNAKGVMAEDCSVMLSSPQGGELCMMMMMAEAGLPIRHVLIWKKNAPTFSLGRLDYDYQHEPILFTWGKRHKNLGKGEHRTSVWSVDKPIRSPDHPTTKPVALPANAILNHTDAGDIVLDIYCGSGTTLVAAEQLGRIGCGIEISPAYVAVILERLSNLGLQPRLDIPPA